MKKVNLFAKTAFLRTLAIMTGFVVLLSFAGCRNFLNSPPPNGESAPAGKGYVRLVFGVETGRTVMPVDINFSVFDAIEFIFTPSSGDPIPYNSMEPDYELPAGTGWTLEAYFYSDAEMENLAASGTSDSFDVTSGGNTPVTVLITFEEIDEEADDGFLEYEITYTGDKETIDEFEIYLTKLSDNSFYASWTDWDTSEWRDKDHPSDYYLVNVRLEKDIIEIGEFGERIGAKRAIWTDIIHIYPGQTTVLEHEFTDDDFYSGIEEIWLVGDMNGWNLRNTPMSDPNDIGAFTWPVDLLPIDESTPRNYSFRFSLTDTTGWGDGEEEWNGAWFAPFGDGITFAPDTDIPMNHVPFGTDSGDGKTWKITVEEEGYYLFTVNPFDYTFTVTKPVSATDVIISGPEQVQRGSTVVAYTAEVKGKNSPVQTVAWSITGAVESGTVINSTTGKLDVDEDETAETITVIATSAEYGIIGELVVTLSDMAVIEPSWHTSTAGLATWTFADDDEIDEYEVELFHKATAGGSWVITGFTDTVPSGGTLSYDFLPVIHEDINLTGFYSFTVTALDDQGTPVTTSSHADPSDEFERRATVVDVWWHNGDTARWVDLEDNGDYIVEVYEGSRLVDSKTVAEQHTTNEGYDNYRSEWRMAADGVPSEVGAPYTFKVIAKSTAAYELPSASAATDPFAYDVFGTSKVFAIAEGDGKYVAGGEDGKLAYSNNGTTWYLSSQEIFGGSWVRGIAYSTDDEVFVAVGHEGKAARSIVDGDTWGDTWEEVTGFTSNFYSIAYGNETFIAGGAGGNVRFISSTNASGVSPAWSTVTGFPSAGSTILDEYDVLGIAYGNTKFVAVGSNGMAAFSGNGTTDGWVWSGNLTSGKVKSIVFGGGTFVAIAEGNEWLPISSNPDPNNGGSWSWKEHLVGTGIEAVAYSSTGTRFLAVGANGKISYSTDSGDSWEDMTVGEGAGQTQFVAEEFITAIGSGSGKFILHGNRYDDVDPDPDLGKMAVINWW